MVSSAQPNYWLSLGEVVVCQGSLLSDFLKSCQKTKHPRTCQSGRNFSPIPILFPTLFFLPTSLLFCCCCLFLREGFAIYTFFTGWPNGSEFQVSRVYSLRPCVKNINNTHICFVFPPIIQNLNSSATKDDSASWCPQAWWPEFGPGIHIMEEEN